jgi:hypothetical protein
MSKKSWIPAYAGMTGMGVSGSELGGMEFRSLRFGDLFRTDDG